MTGERVCKLNTLCSPPKRDTRRGEQETVFGPVRENASWNPHDLPDLVDGVHTVHDDARRVWQHLRVTISAIIM